MLFNLRVNLTSTSFELQMALLLFTLLAQQISL